MVRRSRTSSKARALAATAGFALALTPAGLALAETSQTTTTPTVEQPAQNQTNQTTTPAPASSTPSKSVDSPANDQAPVTNNGPDVVEQPTSGELTTPAGATTSSQTNQSQDAVQRVDDAQSSKSVKEGDEQSAKSGSAQTDSTTKETAGSLGTDARAIKFALNGDLSKVFDVYYRTHVKDRGWLGWTANGAVADTTNSETIDAINVTFVAKGGGSPSNVSSTYTTPVFTPNWKSNTIETYINWTVGIANDNSHGYSQYNRWGPDYDCSSFVITALKNAGLNTGSAITTHNMLQELT